MNRPSTDPARDLSPGALLGLSVAFALALAHALANNANFLLQGYDGRNWIVNLENQYRFHTPYTQYAIDHLSGLSDVAFPAWRDYLLPYVLATPVTGASVPKPWIYFVYAMLITAATYALGRVAQMPRSIALTAAFAGPLLLMPVFGGSYGVLYPLASLNPHIVQSMAATLLIVTFLWWADASRPVRALGLALGAILIVMGSIQGLPSLVVLMVPVVAAYGLGAVVTSATWGTAAARTAIGLAAAAVPAALGAVAFLWGISFYTAFTFFPEQYPQVRTTLYFASIAYHDGWAGRLVVGLGIAGSILAALRGARPLRSFGRTHLAVSLVYHPVALAVVILGDRYQGPSPLYFETFMWPVSLLFSAYAVRRGLDRLVARVGTPAAGLRLVSLPIVPLVFAALAGLLPSGNPGSPIAVKPTAITEYLQREVGLVTGGPFKGNVATFAGDEPSGRSDWFKQVTFDHLIWNKTGNDHRGPGLWAFGIPTLFQYSTYITPAYSLMLTQFLGLPDNRQIRSVALLTRPNEAILALFGTHFIITDGESLLGETRVTLPVGPDVTLRLVELRRPANLGNFSPTEVKMAATVDAALAVLREPGFDGSRRVVLEQAPGPLVAAGHARLEIIRDGLRLTAASPGQSLLVLPAQFSHCWTVEGSGLARLVRANLMLLGVLFSGEIDLTLKLRLGPLLAGSCRLADLRAFRTLVRSP